MTCNYYGMNSKSLSNFVTCTSRNPRLRLLYKGGGVEGEREDRFIVNTTLVFSSQVLFRLNPRDLLALYLPENPSLQSVGIDKSIPYQLAPSVGIRGENELISMARSTSSTSSVASNAMDGGKQIKTGPVDFVPHPTARLDAYASGRASGDEVRELSTFASGKRDHTIWRHRSVRDC
jgi:hypothetical protein